MDTEITVSKLLPPEDVRPGDFITLLRETCEFLNLWAACDPLMKREPMLRAEFTAKDAGVPLRVVAVCLPFVLVEDVSQTHRTLDLRRQVVARLDENYARKAMKRLGRARAEREE
jgi:hypothetical protein